MTAGSMNIDMRMIITLQDLQDIVTRTETALVYTEWTTEITVEETAVENGMMKGLGMITRAAIRKTEETIAAIMKMTIIEVVTEKGEGNGQRREAMSEQTLGQRIEAMSGIILTVAVAVTVDLDPLDLQSKQAERHLQVMYFRLY